MPDLLTIKKLIDTAAVRGRVLARSKNELAEVINCFTVALFQGEIVGCCSLEVYNRKLAEIRSLVVASTHQKKGIGKKLVLACLEEAKQRGIYEVLSITDKDAFFEGLGFSKCLNGQYPLFIRP